MFSSLLLVALAGSAVAFPRFNITRTFNLTRRANHGLGDPCAPQPSGSAPKPAIDTVDAFYTNPAIAAEVSASRNPPPNYSLVFFNTNSSVQTDHSYLGYKTMTSLNTTDCARECDSQLFCQAFNIFIERDPSTNPNITSGCANPASTINYKCSWWGEPIAASFANNTGQMREQFQVAITGSSGFLKTNYIAPPAPILGQDGPFRLLGAMFNNSGNPRFISYTYDAGTTYDPRTCDRTCTQITQAARASPNGDGLYNPCNSFVSFVETTNNAITGQYCYFYSTIQDRNAANVTTGMRGGAIQQAFAWNANPQDSGNATRRAV